MKGSCITEFWSRRKNPTCSKAESVFGIEGCGIWALLNVLGAGLITRPLGTKTRSQKGLFVGPPPPPSTSLEEASTPDPKP